MPAPRDPRRPPARTSSCPTEAIAGRTSTTSCATIGLQSRPWLARVLALAGPRADELYGIANVHIRASLERFGHGGAARVFITLRDNLAGQFASEGILTGTVGDPPMADPSIVRKPAFAASTA